MILLVFLSMHRLSRKSSIPTVGFNMKKVQKGHVTLKWLVDLAHCPMSRQPDVCLAGTLAGNLDFGRCGSDIVVALMPLCKSCFNIA